MSGEHKPLANVSLSTMWAIERCDSMADFVAFAHRVGFGMVEANYQLTPPMVSAILGLRDHGDVAISSVHDPGPLPDGVSLRKLPQLSALDESERAWAVRLSRGAIDTAVRLGAKLLVVHPGKVGGLDEAEQRYRTLVQAGQIAGPEARELRRYLLDERQRRRPPFLAALERSLNELAPYAQERGLRIGLENRYWYHEIPLVDEAVDLLSKLERYGVGFWYDVGHAHALDVMGFVDEPSWLDTLGPKVIATHLHDARGMTDHLVPGAGEIDLARVQRLLPDDALRVCELGSFNSEAEVEAGFEHLRKLGFF